ncbi:MAG: cytochrome-c peroxidase [Deltaproteobacteria bacterium]|jgi:cytochrome c peroxidase|nr:cytochrome-c peroxidase [Deltaproteobacteria bacterium]
MQNCFNRFIGATIGLLFLLIGIPSQDCAWAMDQHTWTSQEKVVLRSLWLGSLGPLPVDPSNKYSDNARAAALGRKLFFEDKFSGNQKVSCATCHREDYFFTDNLPLSHGMATTPRRSMPLIGVAYNSWFFWDGRTDSLWSQALGPIENKLEHGISRTMSAYIISKYYREEYKEIFGELPDFMEDAFPQHARPAHDDPDALKAWVLMTPEQRADVNRVYVNMGKAIAAFVRTILPQPSPFDHYVEQILSEESMTNRMALTDDEARGLRLFIGKAKCTNCHNGPMFTNSDFHNLGLQAKNDKKKDTGRADAITQVLSSEFNCFGKYSDANPDECLELRFIETSEEKYVGAFKTPTLRSVTERPPYMHAGQFATIREVLEFYRSKASNPELGHDKLTDEELGLLEAFLHSLISPVTSLQEEVRNR